jgi:hypothetical protein
MRICLIGDAHISIEHDIKGGYDLDTDTRSKQFFKLGSVNKELLAPGTRACDGTDGCIERHEAEGHAGTQACDGTDGCIERHRNGLEKLALSLPVPGQSFKASSHEIVRQPFHGEKQAELTW